MTSINSFKTGGGKSPSFFFFTENNLLMMKTMKNSEKDILLDGEFLLDYFVYLMKDTNHESLLMKIFGMYEIKINDNQGMTFLITENMLGQEKDRIYRCYDLKGSMFGRNEKINDWEIQNGSGTKPLKDENFIELYKSDERGNQIA